MHCAYPNCDGVVHIKLSNPEKLALTDNSGNKNFSMILRRCGDCGQTTCKMCGELATIDCQDPHICQELEDALDE